MEQLIRSGNVIRSHLGTPFGCMPTGYFTYSQEYSFFRRYGRARRYYNDFFCIYREPVKAGPGSEVLVDQEEGGKIFPGREYYAKIIGASKKMELQTLYQPYSQTHGNMLFLSREAEAALQALSWSERPLSVPLRLMNANCQPVSEPGLYRLLIKHLDKASLRPQLESVDLYWHRFPAFERHGRCNPLVLETARSQLLAADIELYLYAESKQAVLNERVCLEYLFSLRAVEALLALDPNLVFAPVFATENIHQHRQRVVEEEELASERQVAAEGVLAMRDYCRRWCPDYEEEAFCRMFPRGVDTLRQAEEWLSCDVPVRAPVDPAVLS